MKIAIVPARSGSQRVTNKNSKLFSNTSLIRIKLDTLSKCNNIDKIVLNTDCQKCIDIAKDTSDSIGIWRREEYFASNDCSNSEFFHHIAQTSSNNDNDILLYCPPTAPMIQPHTIDEMVDLYEEKKLDNLVSADVTYNPVWFQSTSVNIPKGKILKSQDTDPVHTVNFACCITTRKNQMKWKNVIGPNPIFFPIPKMEGYDIDTCEDFKIAEILYTHQNK